MKLLKIDSHRVIQISIAVTHSIFRDDDIGVVVAVLDPVQHAPNAPWSDSKPSWCRSVKPTLKLFRFEFNISFNSFLEYPVSFPISKEKVGMGLCLALCRCRELWGNLGESFHIYSLSIIQYEIHYSMDPLKVTAEIDFGRHFRFDPTKCVRVKKKTKEDALIKVKIKSNATLRFPCGCKKN